MRRRLGAAGAAVLVVVAGLAVTRMPDGAASDITGDALYAVLAYLLVVVLAPRWRPVLTAVAAGAWCVAVELFQLTGLPLRWGEAFRPVMLVLGTVFDARDLVIYVGVVVVCALVDWMVPRSPTAPR